MGQGASTAPWPVKSARWAIARDLGSSDMRGAQHARQACRVTPLTRGRRTWLSSEPSLPRRTHTATDKRTQAHAVLCAPLISRLTPHRPSRVRDRLFTVAPSPLHIFPPHTPPARQAARTALHGAAQRTGSLGVGLGRSSAGCGAARGGSARGSGSGGAHGGAGEHGGHGERRGEVGYGGDWCALWLLPAPSDSFPPLLPPPLTQPWPPPPPPPRTRTRASLAFPLSARAKFPPAISRARSPCAIRPLPQRAKQRRRRAKILATNSYPRAKRARAQRAATSQRVAKSTRFGTGCVLMGAPTPPARGRPAGREWDGRTGADAPRRARAPARTQNTTAKSPAPLGRASETGGPDGRAPRGPTAGNGTRTGHLGFGVNLGLLSNPNTQSEPPSKVRC